MLSAALRTSLLLLALLLSQHVWAGGYWNADYDSLRRVLPRQQSDTAELRTLVHLLDVTELTEARRREEALPFLDRLVVLNQELQRFDDRPYRLLRRGVQFWVNATDDAQAMQLLQQAVELFDETRRPIPRLLIDLAPLYNRLKQSEERLAYFKQKLEFYRVHGPMQNEAACYLVLAGSYRHMGNYNQAISNYLHAADLFKHFDRMLYSNELMVAGSAYADWGNTRKALHYLHQAVALENKYKLEGLRRFYTLQALSRLYLQENQLPQALSFANQALQAARRDSADRALYTAYGLVQKSAVLIKMQQLDQARQLLTRAQFLADSMQLPISGRPGEFVLDDTWARYYLARGDYARAEQRWLMAYRKATTSKFNMLRPHLLQQLIRFYDAQKQPEKGLRYTRTYLALVDSMNAAHASFNIAQYEGERLENSQNAKIADLKHANAFQTLRLRQRSFMLGGVLFVVAMMSGLGVVLYRQLRVNKRTLEQLRQTQTQLVAAEKWAFVGEVSAGIAHELQNPLNFMKRFAEVSSTMLDDMQRPGNGTARGGLEQQILAGLKQNLQEISQHGLRASSIIKDMLEHARTGTDRRQHTDLNQLVTEHARLAYEPFQTKNAVSAPSFTLDLDPNLPSVSLIPQDLGRVLVNLMTNAFQAVGQRVQVAEQDYTPAVRVSTRQLAEAVEIRVHDNGLGIPESIREQIFLPFFTTKAAGEGTGLGLSMSYEIVTKGHGGTLRAETREGEFTEFIITLAEQRG
ncbi:ATP-binding protein [Hymenobacter koreensis]|uniref:ATP-binding protein n=1 Tax=Hymenobacter koreensis TaxID=1084523 RepID=UPI0031EFA133